MTTPFICEFSLNQTHETFEFHKVAKQADGSVLYRQGNSVLLATVVSEHTMIEEDFIPLTVQYIEKSYAVGKIPGGFVKREGKPNDFETLTSRVIDRSLRPLFPKGFNYPSQITVTVLSADQESDLQVMALKAASAALFTSDIPVDKMVVGVRIGKIDGELVLNPSLALLEQSTLDLYVAGTKDELLMIEMMVKGSKVIQPLSGISLSDPMFSPAISETMVPLYQMNEMREEELIEALKFASEAILKSSSLYEDQMRDVVKPTRDYILKNDAIDPAIRAWVLDNYGEAIKGALQGLAKSERSMALKHIVSSALSHPHVESSQWCHKSLKNSIEDIKRMMVRAMILDEKKRADGRDPHEIRPITIETNLLPQAHGSCLFTRGQTQALVVATLGTDIDKQGATLLTDKGNRFEGFMFHYNFPGYSVGEASRIGAPGRRELGHGNLAKRALESSVDSSYDHAIRLVSEILESNGSSSMASVCGGSLALKAADIPVQKLVAGIAMGLVTDDERYVVLSDIMGLEDHDGDMDFKVAGTRDGITAMQMDIKLGGISYDILAEALYQAKEGRHHILGLMEAAAEAIVVNEDILPSSEFFTIATDKIVEVIGQAGKTIKEIIERFEVAIDLDRATGGVKVVGRDKAKVKGAREHIETIVSRAKMGRGGHDKPAKPAISTEQYKLDDIFTGVVKRVADFGAFVELPGGFEGLMHISKIGKSRIANIHSVIKEGDSVEVKIIGVSPTKIELAMKEPI